MQPDTIRTVTNKWIDLSVDRQIVLITKFLDRINHGNAGDWVEFLARELGTETEPS